MGIAVGFIPAHLNTWFIVSPSEILDSRYVLQAEESPTSRTSTSCWSGFVQSALVSCVECGFMSDRRVAEREKSFMAVARPMPRPASVMRMDWLVNGGANSEGEFVEGLGFWKAWCEVMFGLVGDNVMTVLRTSVPDILI